jgi:NAD(P)-dependent dehydrogenase (short-subunit alcohol dehydrogenase family)
MKAFRDKVAVVTGAASGLGKAMARDFARRGMKLALADIEPGPLATVEAEIAALGVECLAHVTDVSRAESVRGLADAVYERFGKVHVLCNNAGVTAGGVTLAETRLEDWQWVLGVNLWGVIHGLDAFLARMIAQGGEAHIVNTASILGMVVSWPRTATYVASKFAVVGLSEALALELEGTEIGVSVLCPSSVDTRIYESARNRPEPLKVERPAVDLRARMRAVSAHWITPEEVSARVMDAIAANRVFIFTHADSGGLIDARFARIRSDFRGAFV